MDDQEDFIARWRLRLWYEWMKFELRWSDQVGQFSDGSYRFWWFILTPAPLHSNHHDIIREFETFLVWRIGSWYLVIV